jgi:SAM-dependent methyltransferase
VDLTQDGNGWETSAKAWINAMGNSGDYGRVHVLDAPMMERVRKGRFERALDVGCGEGRFCRMLREAGIEAVGVEPTRALREAAQARDNQGSYVDATAESLPFPESSFDLVISYLSMIDIEGLEDAIQEMARVLRPHGSLLIANLNSFNTAGGWRRPKGARPYFEIDNYLDERPIWSAWNDIGVKNWHRPLSTYMRLLLGNGLRLIHYDEPRPTGGDSEKAARYARSPYFNLMECQKA